MKSEPPQGAVRFRSIKTIEDHNWLVLRPRSLCRWRGQRVCFLTFQSSDAVVFELAAVRVSGVAETMWAVPQAQVLHQSQGFEDVAQAGCFSS